MEVTGLILIVALMLLPMGFAHLVLRAGSEHARQANSRRSATSSPDPTSGFRDTFR